MRKLKRGRTFLAWGNNWAFQAYFYPCVSFGFHFDPRKPLLDVHFFIFTLALGPNAHITGQKDRQRHSCRGFLFATDPEL